MGTQMPAAIPALIVLALVPASGCAMFPPTLEEQGVVEIRLQDSERIHFETVNAFAEDEGFKLRGTVHQFAFVGSSFIRGHVDVSLRSPDGRETKKMSVPLVPRARPRHTSRKADFTVRFGALPARGSMLLVTYHQGTHPLSRPGSSGG